MKIIFLVVSALAALSFTGACDLAEIPASEDIYVDLGTFDVHNTNELRCDAGNFSNFTLVQFDISQVNITDEDIGVLVLKAARIEEENESPTASSNISSIDTSGIILLPTVSNWNENSGIGDLLVSLQSMVEAVAQDGLNLGKVGVCFDGDSALAFDVSKSLREAKAKGDRASFILSAFSFKNYSVAFRSRETGFGPYLLIMPYPYEETKEREGPQTSNGSQVSQDLSPINQNESLSASINEDANESVNEPINESINEDMVLNESTSESMNKSVDESSEESVPDLNESHVPESNNTLESRTEFKTPFAQNAIQEIVQSRSHASGFDSKAGLKSLQEKAAANDDVQMGLEAPDADIW